MLNKTIPLTKPVESGEKKAEELLGENANALL